MLPIKNGQEAIVKHIILEASYKEITPTSIKFMGQSPTHIKFLFEQLAMFGYLSKLTNGHYVRA